MRTLTINETQHISGAEFTNLEIVLGSIVGGGAIGGTWGVCSVIANMKTGFDILAIPFVAAFGALWGVGIGLTASSLYVAYDYATSPKS